LPIEGFPETARHADVSFCQRILREDVVERVLKRDMTALFNVRNVNALERLFIYICLYTGSILDVQTCANALKMQRSTIDNHLELLEQANLIHRLPPVEIGGKKILKARNKVYLGRCSTPERRSAARRRSPHGFNRNGSSCRDDCLEPPDCVSLP